jgi:hypothetical protein
MPLGVQDNVVGQLPVLCRRYVVRKVSADLG